MEDITKSNKTITNKIAENYMAINILGIGMVIYIIIFPFISEIAKKVIPSFGICPYLQMTGNPCPLCGGTRYFANIYKAFYDIEYLWHPFGIIAIVLLLEFIFRTKNIIDIKRKKNMKKIIQIDMLTTIIITIAFFTYEILYFVI